MPISGDQIPVEATAGGATFARVGSGAVRGSAVLPGNREGDSNCVGAGA